MSTKVTFLTKKGDCFVLKYITKCADGNGWTMPCTIEFLYNQGKVILRKFVSNFSVNVIIIPTWQEPKKQIEYICKFLKESKNLIEKKVKSKEYKTQKVVSSFCDY